MFFHKLVPIKTHHNIVQQNGHDFSQHFMNIPQKLYKLASGEYGAYIAMAKGSSLTGTSSHPMN